MTRCYFSARCTQEGTRRESLGGLYVCDSCFDSEKFIYSEYPIDKSWFPSFFVSSPRNINEIVTQRSIGECSYEDEKGRNAPGMTSLGCKDVFYKRLSDRLSGKSDIDMEDVHAACFLSFVALKSGVATVEETLGDKGLVHEMVHKILYPTEPILMDKEELTEIARNFEEKIPGGVYL